MDERHIRLLWEGNNSKKYDGIVQDIKLKFVKSGDISVGGNVRVKMGKSKKLWKAIVVDLLEEEPITPPASPIQKQPTPDYSDDEVVKSKRKVDTPPPKKLQGQQKKAGKKVKTEASFVNVHRDSPVSSPPGSLYPEVAQKASTASVQSKAKIDQLEVITKCMLEMQRTQAMMMEKLMAVPAPKPASPATPLQASSTPLQPSQFEPTSLASFQPTQQPSLASFQPTHQPSQATSQPSQATRQPSQATRQPSQATRQPSHSTSSSTYNTHKPYFQKGFSPTTKLEAITTRYDHEREAGRMSVNLATSYFFGESDMSNNTAGTLEKSRMDRLKAIVLSKFGARRSEADREEIWGRCKRAIGQKCKQLRNAKCTKM